MRLTKIFMSTAATVCMLISAVAVQSGVAGADETRSADRSAPMHCVTVIDKAKPGEKASRTVERRCNPAGSNADRAAQQEVEAQGSSLLIRYWEHTAFSGKSDSIYGLWGSCDSAGYGISDLGWFNNRISSLRTYGSCTYTRGLIHKPSRN